MMENKITIGILTERMLKGFGVDLVIDQTARYLSKAGYKVVVFTKRNDGTLVNDLYQIVEIPFPYFKNPLKTEKYLTRFLKNLDKEAVDLWIVHGYPFFLAAKVMSRPVIAVDHGVSSTQGFPLVKKLGFALIKYLNYQHYFKHAKKIINISEFVFDQSPGFLGPKKQVIYNGSDHYPAPDPQVTKQLKKNLGFEEDELILLYVGRLNHQEQPYKGVEELVATFRKLRARHPKLKLLAVGAGKERDWHKLTSREVTPLLMPPAKTLAMLYSFSDIYVSASKWEGFNLPLAEAASFGLPAVVYDKGAHREVMAKDGGFLVENQAEFLEKLEQLIENKELRQKMGEEARKAASRFSWEAAGKQYQAAVESVLEENRKVETPERYQPGQVDVVIINYNGAQYLPRLLESIKNQTYSKVKTIIWDNASTDNSREIIKRELPQAKLITSKKNLLFAKANNRALKKAQGEYVLFLNNDTWLAPQAIEEMVAVFQRRDQWGMAGVAPKMKLGLKADTELLDAVGISVDRYSSPFNRGFKEKDEGQYDKEEEVLGACFGAALIRRKVLEEVVGPLDETYGSYFEDVDWSLRARLMGYKFYTAPKAVVYHEHSGAAAREGESWKKIFIWRNYLKTVLKIWEWKNALRIFTIKKLEIWGRTIFPKKDHRFSLAETLKILGGVAWSWPVVLKKRIEFQKKRILPDSELARLIAEGSAERARRKEKEKENAKKQDQKAAGSDCKL